jgi:hypothetical protein
MTLSLKESQVAGALAGVLYDLLPGSGNKAWRGHVTFATVATQVGVGDFWPGGSKEPAIQALLELTLEQGVVLMLDKWGRIAYNRLRE